MRTIELLIESRNGHNTQLIPSDNVAEKVNEQIANGNFATIEKTDNTSQTLTKEVPKENWKGVFGENGEKVQSVISSSRVKGG